MLAEMTTSRLLVLTLAVVAVVALPASALPNPAKAALADATIALVKARLADTASDTYVLAPHSWS
jgi:hypothetical protein